ncbi:glutathione s-transferase [Colletotrichum musicola]|uniref:Glutathione s-transferase n=1 Tax=Colletotrichum musicola TaxID=2175873 RepID=A0A8H6NWA0_9PEZI|nr:glutathione s-transferase [Colletotrichum musicola]
MLASRAVCAQCRLRLLSSGAAIGSVRPSSTMSSAPAAATADHDPKTTTSRPAQAQPSDCPSRTKIPPKRGANDTQQRALDLFESTVKKGAPAAASGPTWDINKILQLAEKLRTALQKQPDVSTVESAAKCWTLVVTEALPMAREYPDIPAVLLTQVMFAIQKVTEAKLAAVHAAELPNVADICKLLADFGKSLPQRRLDIITRFLNAILTPRPDPDAPESDSNSLVIEERFLGDLVEFWKHFSGLGRTESGLNHPTEFWLTSRPELRDAGDPKKLFPTLMPQLKASGTRGLGPALVTTYVLLEDPAHAQIKAREQAQLLLEVLGPIVKRFDREMLLDIFDETSPMWKYVEPRAVWRVIQEAPKYLRETSAPEGESQGPSQKGGRFSYSLWHQRFSVAYRGNDHAAIQQAWRDLSDSANDKDRAKKLKTCPELLDYVLHISCHKSRYEKEIYTKIISEVLGYMQSIELEPSIRTYTSMMEGWKKARRLEPIENLWKSITAAGVRLDEHIWSSRISANGELGDPWSGLKCLTHMDRAWKAAVEKQVPQLAVKPGIASVNAAIAGLLRRDRMEYVNKTLAWAKERGIQPDIYTFNMILSWMLKKGANEQADRLLASMKTAGVTPDGATFTIILEAALHNLPSQTPQEQRAAVDNVFRVMAASGIEPNQETYGKMLSTLTRDGDNAQVAVATVLARLRATGTQPSTEICTMLVDYYAQRSQPDLESIRALVMDRRSRTRALTDRIFWEMVIKQYHRAGDLEGALEIFYDLDDWGIRCKMSLLEPLLRSLVHRQDWDAATKFVSTVRRQAGDLAADPNNRFWKHGFWAVAKDYDLLGNI